MPAQDHFRFDQPDSEGSAARAAPLPVAPLDDRQRLACLRLIRSENVGPVVKDQWYDFVYHVKWSSGTDGYFQAWVNGVLKLDHRGPTLYQGYGVYLKLANSPHTYLLVSVVGGERFGRYSFIGLPARILLRAFGRRVEIVR